MEIRGRAVVIAVFAIGLGLSGAAWWSQYRETDQSAAFWGRERAVLLLRSDSVELLSLQSEADGLPDADDGQGRDESRSGSGGPVTGGPVIGEPVTGEPIADERVAGRLATRTNDLSEAPGLVHLRHSLTYDDNYDWDEKSLEASRFDASYALRFRNDGQELVLLFPGDFTRMGRLEADGSVTALSCRKMASTLVQYLRAVKALDVAAAE